MNKHIIKSLSLTLVAALTLSACDTQSGALIGGGVGAVAGAIVGKKNPALGALIGGAGGAIVGGILGRINEQQRAKLQATSPRTLRTIQHNDEVAANRPAHSPSASTSPKEKAPAMTKLTVDDIKALSSAGVSSSVIVSEIKKSNSTYNSGEIASAQSDSSIDASVVAAMKRA